MRFQRLVQTITLGGFLALLVLAGNNLPDRGIVDFFLRMDPLIGIGTIIAIRDLVAILWPALVVVALTLVLGRIFCGHICPMGTTLDIMAATIYGKQGGRSSKSNAAESDRRWKSWKYLFLGLIIVAAIFGASLVHLGSPLSWATRIWGLLVYPMALLGADASIAWIGGLLSDLGEPSLIYVQPPQRVVASGLFVFGFLILMFGLVIVAPRFWCRYLCPSGAILALFSRRPLIHRQVSDDCINCGQCVARCPTAAICEDPSKTLNHECVVCLKCREICPVSAISFQAGPGRATPTDLPAMPERRALILSGVAGLLSAGVVRSSIHRPEGLPGEAVLKSSALIRPPAAKPEREFLRLCVRCGECIKACPTSALQPIWFMAGPEGLFSPVLRPRVGACALNCNECLKVCPTGAIRYVPLREKQSVKMGTAWIVRQNCLVWEQDRKCLVCDEVCPYNALSFRPVKGLKNAAPFVLENRCTGCGWCENKCPVLGASAIRVNVIGEVRLAEGSYLKKAKQLGLEFRTKDNRHDELGRGAFDDFEPAPQSPDNTTEPEKEGGDLPAGFILE